MGMGAAAVLPFAHLLNLPPRQFKHWSSASAFMMPTSMHTQCSHWSRSVSAGGVLPSLSLFAEVLACFLCRIWENLRKGSTPDIVAQEQDELVAGLEVAFTALDRIQKAAESFEVGRLWQCHSIREIPPGSGSETQLSVSVLMQHISTQ